VKDTVITGTKPSLFKSFLRFVTRHTGMDNPNMSMGVIAHPLITMQRSITPHTHIKMAN